MQTYAYSTIKSYRKNLQGTVIKAKLKTGESVFRHNGPMLALRWCDKRAVPVISTIHY